MSRLNCMDSDMRFRLNVSLQDLAGISTAIYFWIYPAVEAKIIKYFLDNLRAISLVKSDENDLQEWQEIVGYVLKNIATMNVSNKLFKNISDKICIIGDKIFYWGKQTIKAFDTFELDFIIRIQWTVFGTVDESKTFKSALQKNPKLSVEAYAFLYVEIDYIKQNLNQLSRIVQSYYKSSNLKNFQQTPYVIITMYACYYFSVMSELRAAEFYTKIKKSESPPVELFKASSRLGYRRLAKYFYSKIKNKNDKKKILMTVAKECLKTNEIMELGDYRKEKFAEILVFFMNEMNYAEKLLFIWANMKEILSLFSDLWPYKNLCLPIINFIWPKLIQENRGKILDMILSDLAVSCSSKINPLTGMRKSYGTLLIEHDILKELLKKMSGSRILYKKLFLEQNVAKFLRLGDLDTLNILFTNVDVINNRKYILADLMPDIGKCMKTGKYEIIDMYLKFLCPTDKEKKFLKLNLSSSLFELLIDCINDGQFDIYDKALNWHFDTIEQKSCFLREMCLNPPTTLSMYADENFHELTDKYIKWYYSFTNEKNKVKEALYKSLCNEIFFIWGKTCVCGSKFAKERCLDFLKSFLKTDEDLISFQKEAFEKNENFVKNFCDKFAFEDAYEISDGFDTIDEFFEFCFIDIETLGEIKKKIIDNINYWIESYGIKADKFQILDPLLRWLMKNDHKKRLGIIKTCLESETGALLCASLLENCKDEREASVLLLFNNWIRPLGDFSMMKEQINNLRSVQNTEVTEKSISSAIALLNKLEPDSLITRSDIGHRHTELYLGLNIF